MFSRLGLSHFVLLGALVLLTACGTTPSKEALDPAVQRTALEKLNAFRVTGGLGVWTDQQSVSTRIDWKQSGQDFDVLVRLPAGLSSVQVTQSGDVATVKRGNAEPVIGRSATRLMQQALGMDVAVPIQQMSLWIRGLPGDASESVKYDELERLASMNFRDSQGTLWRAKVSKYTVFDDVYVPEIITASGGPYNIRLVLKTWSKPDLEALNALKPGTSGSRLKVPGR